MVTDRDGNLLYANPYAVALFGFPDHAAHLVGRSAALDSGSRRETRRGVTDLVKQVLRGRPWEGTLRGQQVDGSRLLIRARAAAAATTRPARSTAS